MNSVFSGHFTEIFLVSLHYRDLQNESSYSVQIRENTNQEKQENVIQIGMIFKHYHFY